MDWIIDGYNVLIGNDLGSDEAARLKMGVLIEDRFRGKSRLAGSVGCAGL